MSSKALFLLTIIFVAQQTWSAGNSTDNLIWGGTAVGNITALKPRGEVDFGPLLLFVGGVEARVFKSPLVITFSLASGTVISSNMKYNYTAPGTSNLYQESEQRFNGDMTYLGLGAKLRVINMSWLKLYGEYGGIVGHHKFKYNEITLNGINPADEYVKSNERVYTAGTYYEAGIDFIPFKAGVRLAGRYTKQFTNAMPELAGQKLVYEEIYGYLAIVAGF